MLDQPKYSTQKPRAVGAKSSSLGSIAELSSKPQKPAKTSPKDALIRTRFKLLNAAAKLLPNERIAKCQKWLAPNEFFVEVHRTTDKKSAIFKHLQHCESYACPVCAYFRAEHDRHELSVALSEAKKRGWTPVLISATASHHWGDNLEKLMDGIANAYDGSFSGRWYQELKQEWSIVGKIGSWDITIGINGWHPHKHILMFLGHELSKSQIEHFSALLKERWMEKIKQQGLQASWAYGLDVRTADSDIADYIAKFGREPIEQSWGIEKEIALAPAKKAHMDGMTMFELLSACAGNLEPLQAFSAITHCTDRQKLMSGAGYHYKEYFMAFKGKPRIHWGSMRKLLDLDEALKKFAEENPEKPADTEPLAVIELNSWRRISDTDDDMRAELAIFARDCTHESLKRWFELRNLTAKVLLPPEKQPELQQVPMFERSLTTWL